MRGIDPGACGARDRGSLVSWRDHVWEFTVGAISWLIAIGALAFVVAFIAYDALKDKRKKARR